jgi:hypothetical protein
MVDAGVLTQFEGLPVARFLEIAVPLADAVTSASSTPIASAC